MTEKEKIDYKKMLDYQEFNDKQNDLKFIRFEIIKIASDSRKHPLKIKSLIEKELEELVKILS